MDDKSQRMTESSNESDLEWKVVQTSITDMDQMVDPHINKSYDYACNWDSPQNVKTKNEKSQVNLMFQSKI